MGDNSVLIKQIETRQQSGTALISVLLIFAICAVLAIEMQARQHLDIRRTSNMIAHDQAYLYIDAAEEIAIDLLIKDLEHDQKKGVNKDYLKEDWHIDNQMYPIDPDKNISAIASLEDLQSRININWLMHPNQAIAEDAQRILEKLMSNAGLPKTEENPVVVKDMLAMLIDWMDVNQDDHALTEGEDYYYQGLRTPYRTSGTYFNNISELRRVRGFSDYDIAELEADLAFLPPSTAVNINTVSEKIAALLQTNGADIVSNRGEKGYDDVESAELNREKETQKKGDDENQGDTFKLDAEVYSEYFLLTAEILIGEQALESRSVIYRPREPSKENPIRVIMRHRNKKFHYAKKESSLQSPS
jgi:general secretion pathway protein K